MSELHKEVEELREKLRPVHWSGERSDSVLRNIERRRRRFTISTVALGSAVLAMAASIAIIWFAQGRSTQSRELASSQPIVPRQVESAPKGIELGDGSRALGLGGGSTLVLVSETETRVSFSLDSGKAWFDVKYSDTREVEVVIQDVRVVVSGTEFVVEIVDGYVHVWVHRGQAIVRSPDGERTLSKGEEFRFTARNAKNVPRQEEVLEAPETVDEKVPVPVREYDRAKPKEDGEIAKSVEAVVEEGAIEPEAPVENTPVDGVGELWAKSDAARRSGQDVAAIRALATLVNEHAEDPRAALAAFTLGRLLVDSNRQHTTAARAFAKARKLAPNGPLVEDALFREIEAWYAANDKRRVKKRSEKYVRLFPKGRYRRQIQELLERL